MPGPFSLYVHIPYCVSKCPYCDFNSHVAARIPEEEYTQALLRELRHYSESEAWANRPVKTIFFGGGTPSTFQGTSIGAILDETARLFHFDERMEITLEANPGAVDAGRFRDYRRCGVNRISVGAQTFDAKLLQFLGRVHSADETRQALSSIREAGFDNFSLDLIYGIPGQTVDGVSQDLSQALACEPPHLSAYNLTIEEGTPFHARYRQGLLKPLDEEVEIEMADRIQRTLAQAGLERYEISNYARPGLESRHNVNYWEGGDYLGVGAGAHSHHRKPEDPLGERWQNERLPTGYMRRAGESRRRRHRARAPGTSSSHGRAPVHRAADDRRRLGAGVSTAFRNETRERFPRSRGLAVGGFAGRRKPTAAVCAAGFAVGK